MLEVHLNSVSSLELLMCWMVIKFSFRNIDTKKTDPIYSHHVANQLDTLVTKENLNGERHNGDFIFLTFLRVVFPFKTFRLGPKMSSAASTSVTVTGQFEISLS